VRLLWAAGKGLLLRPEAGRAHPALRCVPPPNTALCYANALNDGGSAEMIEIGDRISIHWTGCAVGRFTVAEAA
jgi:hypothetical protein